MTFGCILVTIYCLQSGYTIIFQNLFYIPIILACVSYIWRGFLFSCLLALVYFGMIAGFTQDYSIILQALIRVILFIGIAAVIAHLADKSRRSEEALHHVNQFQENIITNARIWLMVLDRKGRILLWNTAAEEISGYQSEEVFGKNEIWKLLYPETEYRHQVTNTIHNIVSTKSRFDNFETRIRTKTGDRKVISWNTKGISNNGGDVSEYIAIGVDVTDRQIAEKGLRQQTLFLQILMDTLPVPMFYKNLNGDYIGCNTAFERYFGKPRDQIIGKSVYDLWPKDLADVYYQADQTVFTAHTSQQYEASVKYADGSVHQVMFYKAPLVDDKDQVTGLVGALLDITERKRGEEALRQANHKLNLLSSITRHDIGNELQIIFGYLGLVKEARLDPKIHQYIENAYVSSLNIEQQISFTRDYEDIGVHSPIWQDVNQVIIRTIQNIDIQQIQILVEISGVEIFADPLLEKVFYNLIDNAKRYGDTLTEIRFSGFEGNEEYTIICEDDGVGIPNEFKSKIFNREYYKHTGFGLNLSREILDITGITITETGEPGRGARFEIRVPEGKWRLIE